MGNYSRKDKREEARELKSSSLLPGLIFAFWGEKYSRKHSIADTDL